MVEIKKDGFPMKTALDGRNLKLVWDGLEDGMSDHEEDEDEVAMDPLGETGLEEDEAVPIEIELVETIHDNEEHRVQLQVPMEPPEDLTEVDLKKATENAQKGMDQCLDLARMRLKNLALKSKGEKTAFVDSSDDFMECAMEALKSGPQSSALELLLQLECHERLHRRYVSGILSPCLLSFYLESVAEDRWALLDWLGSDLTPESHLGKTVSPPKVPLRLNKIPIGREGLADKGFDGTDRFLPNMNPVRTPLLLRTRKVKQYLRSEVFGSAGNRALCRLRYTSEVAFSRATQADSLKDVIRYSNIVLLQHMHAWGHAMMNLGKPLRPPQNSEQ